MVGDILGSRRTQVEVRTLEEGKEGKRLEEGGAAEQGEPEAQAAEQRRQGQLYDEAQMAVRDLV